MTNNEKTVSQTRMTAQANLDLETDLKTLRRKGVISRQVFRDACQHADLPCSRGRSRPRVIQEVTFDDQGNVKGEKTAGWKRV